MSKVGKVPVTIPDGVKVNISQQMITVSGKHGQLTQEFRPDLVSFGVEDGMATVTRREDGKQYRAFRVCTAAFLLTWSTGWPRSGRSHCW